MMLEIRRVAKKPRGDNDKPAPRITESDTYVAHLVKVQKFKSKMHPDWDDSFRFIFRVLQEPFVGGFASGIRPCNWFPGSKLDEWLTVLGVEQAKEGDVLDVHSIKGQKVRILVKLSNDGFANVTELFSMRDKDHELIAPGALDNDKNYQKKEQASTPAPQTQVTATPAPAATPAPVAETPATPPVQAAPEVKDVDGDEIPF